VRVAKSRCDGHSAKVQDIIPEIYSYGGETLWEKVNRYIGELCGRMTLGESWGDRSGEWQVNGTVSVTCLAVGFRVRQDEPSSYTSEVWCLTEC
jgi:hypothetical protein